jgi:hypothetical protein
LQRDEAELLDPRLDRMSVVRESLVGILRQKMAERTSRGGKTPSPFRRPSGARPPVRAPAPKQSKDGPDAFTALTFAKTLDNASPKQFEDDGLGPDALAALTFAETLDNASPTPHPETPVRRPITSRRSRGEGLLDDLTNLKTALHEESLPDSVTLSDLLGISQVWVCDLRGSSAANFADTLYYVRSLTACVFGVLSFALQRLRTFAGDANIYTEGVRRLQDLCSTSGELPSSIWLSHVAINRSDLIGRGGEVLIYAGTFRGQNVVVREVAKPRAYWTTPAGQGTVKVFVLIPLQTLLPC